ncbi:MAG: hypothetical protein KGL46_03830 [Hyphomicrobiales bacterium]|nr:hypothetical protein [Hyphomicrobiales bacterium]
MATQIDILRTIGEQCLTTAELGAALNARHNKVATVTGTMVLHGLLERIERGCFQLTRAGKEHLASGQRIKSGPKKPFTGHVAPNMATMRQRAWSAMRVKKTFTAADIFQLAVRPTDKSPDANLGKFIRALVKYGVLAETGRRAFDGEAPTSNGRKVYLLVKDLGEIAPRPSYRKNGFIGLVDMNIDKGRKL